MIRKLLTVAPPLALWIALAALTYLVLRELGFGRIRKHPLVMLILAFSLLALPLSGIYLLLLPYQAGIVARLSRYQSPPVILPQGCSVFPADSIWNARVQDLPVDPKSAEYVESMGPDLPLHPDFGAIGGIPFAVAQPNQSVSDVSFGGNEESDAGPYRIPDNAPLELGLDSHVLVIDPSRCMLYELYAAKHTGPLHWEAGSAAIFDLRSNRLRPAGWTSADAAGLPMLPLLARFDEVAQGEIRHALRFSARHTQQAYVWPARHQASRVADLNMPPMGKRFRLKASVDIAAYSQQTQVILRALKEYGMILADNGSPWYITGTQDTRWSRDVVKDFRRVHGSDFEAVDVSSLMANPDSAQVRK